MTIGEFIREQVLQPRLREAGCLVVYDVERRYRQLCLDMAADRLLVIDASDSSIETREAALTGLQALGRSQDPIDGLLVYVPAARPESDQGKQIDPFAVFAECGAVFPQDDGDDYLSVCLRARPDYATEVRKVFAATPEGPPFAVIDAIGGGAHWPQLRTTLGVESAREILVALLAPSLGQTDALKASEAWVQEARDFLRATLGLNLKTRGKTWTAIGDEAWRYVLYSEFVFDLPESLPPALRGVPRAAVEARPIIEDVCEQLRTNPKTRAAYIERAEAIEAELALVDACRSIADLGERDTFPFEERTFLKRAIDGILAQDPDTARALLARHQHSVWLGKGENQSQWGLVRSALALCEACQDFERQLPGRARTQSDLLDFYLASLREADRLQREFEQAVGDFLDGAGVMGGLVRHARAAYRRLSESVQTVFIRHVETSGWPPEGRLANAEVFDRLIADRLKERGRKVAYLMIDALRYELGVALEKLIAEDGPVELQAAYAQVPTVTPVGMASLLPDARTCLHLADDNGTLMPRLGEMVVANVTQRMECLRRRLGDRFAQLTLSDFVRGKPKIDETTDLLVLRSTEIDSQLESNPETTLSLIPGTLKLIRVALHKLRGMGFTEAVIVTDHGFFLNAQAEAGDVCAKPPGTWVVNAHDRLLLGDGSGDANNLVVGAGKLGIRGDFAQAAVPRSMAPYKNGYLYFHGGLSLAEAVVPVLSVRLDAGAVPTAGRVVVELNYKNGAKRITTRTPVIDICLVIDDLFAAAEGVELLLEAQDAKGNVVGEARPGGEVDPATRTVTLPSGQRKQIVLRMDGDFEGKFSVKALNPTTLATYCALSLETDYTV